MALKSSKMTSEQKVKRALAQLDTAVQAWYAEHNPDNKDHYASATVMDNTEYGYHVSRIALNSDALGEEFINITSGKQGHKHGKR